MDFDFSDEQEDLRQTVRAFLDRRSSEADVRRLAGTESGFDETVWQQFAEQIGLAGLLIPEESGGLGAGMIEVGLALEEMGRDLFTSPFLSSSVVASSALVAAGGDQAGEYLEQMAEGELLATLAFVEATGEWAPDAAVATTATPAGGGFTISGEKDYVLDAVSAGLFLVTAAGPDGAVSLFAVPAEGAAITVTAYESLDITRKLARVRFDGAAATLLGMAGEAAEYLREVQAVACIALAAEQLGSAEHCLDSAVAYANTREQFGEKIAQFQAVQHRCADILVEVEAARSAVYFAMWAATERADGWMDDARVAKVVASESLAYAASENLHLHGGNGFTWEFPEQLYFRRARASEQLFGSTALHRDALAAALGV
jgi:alkylation response protein AidB-like acyl-CoA dehydrogenase